MYGKKRKSEHTGARRRKFESGEREAERESERERLCGGGEGARERQTERQKKVRKEICMSSSNRLVLSTDTHTPKLQCSQCCSVCVCVWEQCIISFLGRQPSTGVFGLTSVCLTPFKTTYPNVAYVMCLCVCDFDAAEPLLQFVFLSFFLTVPLRLIEIIHHSFKLPPPSSPRLSPLPLHFHILPLQPHYHLSASTLLFHFLSAQTHRYTIAGSVHPPTHTHTDTHTHTQTHTDTLIHELYFFYFSSLFISPFYISVLVSHPLLGLIRGMV